ncbi:hypothetical protein H4R99_004169 [Coemansia sp. RSA 1722]|nr:hypothetical protein LPJ57_001953 [Coemansia sp. RSA 486]KAJ2232954.1 hypothetical protein IWW45_004574 [Coemansia sp. RSA 485]KAJ2598272.1 hypothetical protein H4R99_004169 [Coemansia sp. RSA 1722]
MHITDPQGLTTRTKHTVSQIKRSRVLDQNGSNDLQRALDTLIANVFSESRIKDASTLEGLLLVIADILSTSASEPIVPRLFECGINSAASVLQMVSPQMTEFSSQGGDLAAMHNIQTIDACLSSLNGAYEKIVAAVEKTIDADILGIGLLCSTKISECLERLSTGDNGMLRSQAIWKSALENTGPVALYLVKICDCAIRLFSQCTGTAIRQQPKLAAAIGQTVRATLKVVDLVAAVFGSTAHLAHDHGMKRSLLEKFSALVLDKHRMMLGAPAQFKALWQALCGIATGFTAVSFDSATLCLRVYRASSDTVRALAMQITGMLKKSAKEELKDPKMVRKLKGPMAFIRFVVFQMPTLVSRVLGKDAAEKSPHWSAVLTSALAMLDTVFGQLSASVVVTRASHEIASALQTLVMAACNKFTLALLQHSIGFATQYLQKLSGVLHATDSEFCSRVPLIEGLGQPVAHREILRVVVENMGLFSIDQQRGLLDTSAGKTSVVQAFALAVDRDPVSVLLPAARHNAGSEPGTKHVEYEMLVTALALSAAGAGSLEVFAMWEHSMLVALLQAPVGSLGGRLVVDAWVAVASRWLPRPAVLSTIDSLLNTVSRDANVLVHGPQLVLRLVAGLLAVCSPDEQRQILASVFENHLAGSTDVCWSSRLCALVPWHTVLRTNEPVQDIAIGMAAKMAIHAKDAVQSNANAQAAEALTALCALVPSSATSTDPQTLVTIKQLLQTMFDQNLPTPANAIGQSMVDSALVLASHLTAQNFDLSSEILRQVASHLDSSICLSASTGYTLARFIGSFADSHIDAQLLRAITQPLSLVFSRLLDQQIPWIVAHETCIQALAFATESTCPEIATELVPESRHEMLMALVQRHPSVDGQMDALDIMYLKALDVRLPCVRTSFGTDGMSSKLTTSCDIVDTARMLRTELESAPGYISGSAAKAVRSELAALSLVINRFLQQQ